MQRTKKHEFLNIRKKWSYPQSPPKGTNAFGKRLLMTIKFGLKRYYQMMLCKFDRAKIRRLLKIGCILSMYPTSHGMQYTLKYSQCSAYCYNYISGYYY